MEYGYFQEKWPFMSFLSCFWRDVKNPFRDIIKERQYKSIDQISKFKSMVVYTVLASTSELTKDDKKITIKCLS